MTAARWTAWDGLTSSVTADGFIALACWFALDARRDPRRLRVGVLLLAAALVGNGITMVRREGRRLGNLLSGLLGLLLLEFFALAVLAVLTESYRLILWLLAVMVPAGYLAFGFSAYLLWSWLYQRGVRRWAKPTGAVVVLGSGLVGGRVSPLLASRLDVGRTVFEHARGVEPAVVVREDRSRTTQQNLGYTRRLLAERGVTGSVTVVTNNFHAFRAATLLRRTEMEGHVVGAPTAGYYWPSATIREYVALLRDGGWLTVAGLVLAGSPLVVLAVVTVAG
ncbi:YdcF family protein [Xylanimonas ulmi]|uniref:Uncharacterized SAM-binding protein YcdF (DUF218 family) n=1 Tax=Xylanimonas ulmi TaxID=228973 RepID=A0A4Q7M7F6_9MICO|nr:YdcF family protein [Xylanibacterium ulmi]RZS62588.1 uncharacterized SAM-binding protein YcdF (DUF218 family) [Xylanibacterium ulmi]